MGLVEAERSEKRTRGWLQRKMLGEGVAASRSSVEQRVVVAALGSSMKENAMWHVPHHLLYHPNLSNFLIIYEYISPYLVFLTILEFFPCPISHATKWACFNITKLLANRLTKPSVFLLLCEWYFVILFQ